MDDMSSNHPTDIKGSDEGRWRIRYWSRSNLSRAWVIMLFIIIGIACLFIVPNLEMVFKSGIWGFTPLSILLIFLGYMAFLVSPLRPILIDWDGEYLSFRGLYPFGINNIFPENFLFSHLEEWSLDETGKYLMVKIYHPTRDSKGNIGYSMWHFLPLDGIRPEDNKFLIHWLNSSIPDNIQTF